MKKTLLFTLLLAISAYASAQVPLSLTTTSTTTNFDGGTLDNNINGSSLNTFPTGWGLAEQGTSSNANGFYRAGSGSSTVGDARSYGAFGTTERAFGALSNSTLQAWLGFAFTNNIGSNITSMNVSYRGEQWRSGGPNTLLDSLLFEYSLNASSIGDMSATWIRVSALDFLSPNPTAVGGTSNGNLASSQANVSSVITAIVANNDTVHFRWRDINVAGINDGLAIDDFAMTVTTTGGPLPPTLLSTNPADNSTNVSLSISTLSLTLDQNITSIGTGNVQLTNVTSASSITIPSANISFSGATLSFSGFILNPNTNYAVQVAPNMLVTANGGYIGITDNTTWNFMTGTSTTGLNELTESSLSVKVLGDVTSQLNLETQSAFDRNMNYTIVDMAGKTVYNGVLTIANGEQQHTLNVSSLNAGIYLLQLHNNQEQSVIRFVVK